MNAVVEDIGTHYLYPATLFVNRERYKVTTVLGSCIAVCLYDTQLKIGGMNHFMLPLWNGEGLASPKYGNVAIDKLIKGMENLGSNRKNIIAKVFGGSNLSEGVLKIGTRNTQVAFDHLENEKIRVIAQSIGGNIGRKVIYDTHNSEVMMKYVQKQRPDGK
ncbi:MAG: chemotaxis protein CheD [Bacteroidota bacterium]